MAAKMQLSDRALFNTALACPLNHFTLPVWTLRCVARLPSYLTSVP